MSAGLGISQLRPAEHQEDLHPSLSHLRGNIPEDREEHAKPAASSSMQYLDQIAEGGAMVQLDIAHSGIRQGQVFGLDCISPGGGTRNIRGPIPALLFDAPQGGQLIRHGTLLSTGEESSKRAATQLRTLLGNSHGKLKPGATVPPALDQTPYKTSSGTPCGSISYEKAKSRARVELDMELESQTYVQGCEIRGIIKLHIRKPVKSEWGVLLSSGKVRVVGFEHLDVNDSRHIFFQCSSLISQEAQAFYTSKPDRDGFSQVRLGVHEVPFSIRIPSGSECKGSMHPHSGASIQYILVASWQIKDAEFGKRSIAHFYRRCEIWPRLNPSVALGPISRPISVTKCQSLFMGGNGEVELTASLHRLIWVAGQQCWVNMTINNNSKKIIKSIELALLRTTVIFRAETEDPSDLEGVRTTTTEKQVAENTLSMGDRGTRGHASAKGWWAGVLAGGKRSLLFSLALPADAITISPGHLVEINYKIKVAISAGALSSDISVNLPIRIISFLSLDPPSQVHQEMPYPTRPSPIKSAPQQVTADPTYSSTTFNDCDGNHSDAVDMSYAQESSPQVLDSAPTPEEVQCSADHDARTECHQEHDDDEDFVQLAISQSRLSEDRQPTFSDLYLNTANSQDMSQSGYNTHLAPARIEEFPQEDAGDGEVVQGLYSIPRSDSISRPGGPRGPSSFAERVQRKKLSIRRSISEDPQFPQLQDTLVPDSGYSSAEHSQEHDIPDDFTSRSSISSNQPRALPVVPEVASLENTPIFDPSGTSLPSSHGSYVSQQSRASSHIGVQQTFNAPSQQASEGNNNSALIVIPCPSSGSMSTLSLPRTAQELMESNKIPGSAQAMVACPPVLQASSDSTSSRPVSTASAAMSVKDKIKELEARVRAAEAM